MPRTPEQQRQYNENYKNKPGNREKLLARKKVYYQANKKRISEYRKKYYTENKEEFLENQRSYYASDLGRRKKIISKARERAKKAGFEFDISVDDITLPTYCPYLGIELTHELGKGQLRTNSSIDRIDSSKGYIKGNVQIISRIANTMKCDASIEELKTFARNILRIYGNA